MYLKKYFKYLGVLHCCYIKLFQTVGLLWTIILTRKKLLYIKAILKKTKQCQVQTELPIRRMNTSSSASNTYLAFEILPVQRQGNVNEYHPNLTR